MIRILHCADIHLDSPFSAQTPNDAAERRRQLRQTFADMAEFAREKEVDLFLICGDLFDREYVTRDTADFVCRVFESAPKVRFVIIPGNHDPYTEGGIYRKTVFPANVTVFKSETLSCVSFPELKTDVYGYAYHSAQMAQNPFAGQTVQDPSRINLLMAHGSLNGPPGSPCPFTEADIINSGFDYYALGHYHNTEGIRQAGHKWYGYCGCPQGRDFGETGYKGAVYACLSKENGVFSAHVEQIRFCTYRYEILRCNITGPDEGDSHYSLVDGAIRAAGYGTDTALRIVLEGNVPSDACFPVLRLRAAWQDSLAQLEVEDNTLPLLNHEALLHDPSLRGAFYRTLYEDLQSDDPHTREIAALALRYGFAALDGSDLDFD